jgi:hypothetical protein
VPGMVGPWSWCRGGNDNRSMPVPWYSYTPASGRVSSTGGAVVLDGSRSRASSRLTGRARLRWASQYPPTSTTTANRPAMRSHRHDRSPAPTGGQPTGSSEVNRNSPSSV